MYKLSILLFIIAALSLTALSQAPNQLSNQTKCSLTISQSPEIRGIRLGLNSEQVLSLFPGSSEKGETKRALAEAGNAPNYGVARLYFQPFMYPSPAKEAFAGIESYSITLFDGRVTEIHVRYSGTSSIPKGPFWRNVDDFIARLSRAYNLPDAKDWEGSSDTKTLKCADFVIEASTSSGAGMVELHNKAYVEKVRERSAAEEERVRHEFKP